MSKAPQLAQAEFLTRELAVLTSEKAVVQRQLDAVETGLRGWWRGTSLSPDQFQAHTKQKQLLFEAIEATTAELKLLAAPTVFDKLKMANEVADQLTKRLAAILFGGVAFWSTWRYWSILRRRFAPLTKEQWYWRKNWLRVESPYPPAVKGIASVSAAYLVYYYSRHPRELEQWGPQLRPTQTDRVVVQ